MPSRQASSPDSNSLVAVPAGRVFVAAARDDQNTIRPIAAGNAHIAARPGCPAAVRMLDNVMFTPQG